MFYYYDNIFMKKTTVLILVLLCLLIIWLYKNNKIMDNICELLNYCKNINIESNVTVNNNFNIISWDIIQYTTWMKNYEEVWFSPNITGDREIFQKLKSQWKICKEKSYGIGWWSDGCNNIIWYKHTYTISKLWLQIEAYQNAMVNNTDNPGIFSFNVQQPFIVSGSSIKEIRRSWVNTEEYVLQYHDMDNSNTIEKILSNDAKLFWYTWDINLIETGIYNVFYQIWDEYFLKTYYFQTGKNYYYTYIVPWSSCAPWPCGFDRHKVIYFLK
jgi:hypothetical protein